MLSQFNFVLKSSFWILNEAMDTSLDCFYNKLFSERLQISELFLSKLAYSVVSAIMYLRNQKLMHRDIKPANILINSTGEIKVCDFGISGFTTDSMCSSYKGCKIYMPVDFFLFLNFVLR